MVGSRFAGQIPRLVAAALAATGFGIAIDTAMPQVTSAALAGSGTSADPYLIGTCNDLLEIDESAAKLSKTYKLTANINCSGVTFSTLYLASPETYFSGTLNGNGKTISNLTVTCTTYFCGLFRKLAGATIVDLTLSSPTVTAVSGATYYSYVGALAGQSLTSASASIRNVTVTGGTVTGLGEVGGLVGEFGAGTIRNVTSSASVVATANSNAGGIVGSLGYYTSGAIASITNSYSSATVSGVTNVGGLAGGVHGQTYSATRGIFSSVSNATVTADSATGASHSAGGIAGYLSGAQIADVESLGTVTSEQYAGGIVGWSRGSQDLVTRSHSSANVTATIGGNASSTAGGIVGGLDYGTVSRSSSRGTITGAYRIGGIVGIGGSGADIINSYSRSTLVRSACSGSCSNDSSGAIIGRGSYTVTKSYGAVVLPTGSYGAGGDDQFSGSCTSSFWDTTVSGISTTRCSATGKTTAQLKSITTFTNTSTSGLASAWDFVGTPNNDAGTDDYWAIDPAINDGYPYLNGVPGQSTVTTPWGLSLTEATDTGSSAIDGITKVGSVVIEGFATTGDSVQLYVDGVASGSACTAAAGRFSCTPTTLPGGATYAIRAQATSGSTVGFMSNAISVQVDDTVGAPSAFDLVAASDSGSSSTDDITNDTTPTFSGTAEASGIVQLYVDGVASGSTCAAAVSDGAFTCTAATVGPGSRNITAVVTDVAGNVSLASSALLVQIDTTAPSAPTGLDLNAADDSGSSATDNITTTTTLRIAGTADADVVVQLYRNGTATGSTCGADGVGVFECTTATLSAGAHAMTAKAVDAAGNTSSASSSLSVTVDLSAAAPASLDLKSTSDSGSSTSDNLTNDTTPTFSATVENGSVVQLYVDGVASGSTCTATSTSVDCTTATLSDGAKTITMVQTDVVGNVSAPSAGLAITIDSAAPSAPTLQLTAASDSGSSNSDGITNDTTPTFEGLAEPSARVQLKNGGVNSGSVCTANAATGIFACTTAALTAATYTITAVQTDVAGNTSVNSTGVTIEIDTTAPTAPTGLALTTASDNGASTSDRITSITALVITGNGVNGSLVQLKVGGTNSGSTCVVSVGVFSCTTATVSSGVQSITAVQIDSAGNTSGSSVALSVTVDTSEVAPTGLMLAAASDSGSSSSDGVTSATSLQITGTAAAGVTVQLYAGGVATGSTCTANGSGAFSCTTGTLAAGTHSLTATATDLHGNVSAASSALNVTVDTTSSTPTGLALDAGSDTGSSNSDVITNDTTPTITGTAEIGAVVQLSVGGTATGTTCTANGTGAFTCTAGILSEGTLSITAVATDVAGNVSSTSIALSITIDTVAPSVPGSMTGSLTCRPTWCDSDFISATATPSFMANAPNDTRAQLYIAGVATGSVCSTSNGLSAGSFVCTTSSLVDGTYAITAKLLDLAGNESSGSYTARTIQVIAGYVPTTTTSSTTSTTSTTVASTTTSTTSTTVVPTTTTSSTSTSTSTTSTTLASTTTTGSTSTTVAAQTGAGRLVWYANSESGSDTSGTGSQAAPYKTFHRAYSAARAGDTIDLTGTFTWTDAAETGDVAGAGYRLAKNLTIRGQGDDKTIVEAAARENVADRAVFTNSATVTITDLTVRHGKVTGGGQAGGVINRSQLTLRSMTVRDNRSVTASQYSFYTAGGVFTDSNTTLTMDKVTVKDNVCDCIVYAAGGVYALQSANKTITNSTFVGNRASASRIGPYPFSYASAAGAFNTFRFGFTVITNSTFFGNYSADYAGAINIYYQDHATLTNLTVVSNEAAIGAGGILYRSEWDGYNLNMKNVLLANNRGGGVPNDFHAFNAASATRMASSHNIVEASTNKVFDGVGEVTGQQAGLDLAAVLAPNATRNGTDTLLIGIGSIAKDAGDAGAHGGRVKVTPPTVDQRGLARAGQVDIGAFENQSETNSAAVAPATTTTTTSSTTTTAVTRPTTTVARPTSTLAGPTTTALRSTTTVAAATSATPAGRVGTTTTVAEITINPNIVASTVPTATTIPTEDAEDLTVEPTNDTEVRASNDSVEIVLSIVDKSLSELVQGRTGRLVAKQGLFARVRGKGFLAGSLAEVWVYSTPRLLAHLQVSSKGEAAGYVLIPEDMELGEHKVELRGNSTRRRAVKATIPLMILDDGAPSSTVLPTPDDLETALELPTKVPAVVVPAPADGTISIGEELISSVLSDVLGDAVDLSKVKVRLRINKGEWQIVDTSTGKVLAVVVPAQAGENQIDFEVTDENGQTVVVQREVLVEGTPEAIAFTEAEESSSGSGGRWWPVALVVVAVLAALWLFILVAQRRRKRESA